MVIDVHVHPVMFGEICKDPERVRFRKQNFGLYKSSPVPMEQVMTIMDHAGVDLAVLLAEDYSAQMGEPIVSNEEIRAIMDAQPGRFVGFASVAAGSSFQKSCALRRSCVRKTRRQHCRSWQRC